MVCDPVIFMDMERNDKTAQQQRLEAEARALRDNLAKRKAQARGRRAAKRSVACDDGGTDKPPD